MPIEIQCPGCKKKLRVPEKLAGRSSQCPACGAAIQIPASAPQTAENFAAEGPAADMSGSPASAGGDMWHMKTSEGDVYGPVAKGELDAWAAEGRIDQHCHLRPQSSEDWQPAATVYPQLGSAQGEAPADDPFAGIGQQPQPIDENPFAGVVAGQSAVNPFASPQEAGGYASEGDQQYQSDGIRLAMRATRPWVLFLSILGFIVTGLMVLFALAMMGVGMFGGQGAGFGVGLGLIYLVMAFFFFLPSYFMHIYSNRIGTFLRAGGSRPLEKALAAQASFWKLMGILALVVIVLYIGMFAIFVSIGVFSTMSV